MAIHCSKRHAALAISIAAASLALFAIFSGPGTAPIVRAQTTEKDAKYPVQVSLPLPGGVDPDAGAPMTAPADVAGPPATPIAPVPPPEDGSLAGAPSDGNSTTTSLGGSDIAVSSVGGSYEVDGPARKRNRLARQTPVP